MPNHRNVYISLATSMSKTGKFQLTPLVGFCFRRFFLTGTFTHSSSFVDALGLFTSGFLAAVSCGFTISSFSSFCKSTLQVVVCICIQQNPSVQGPSIRNPRTRSITSSRAPCLISKETNANRGRMET